jgi:hypothetical protein
MSNVCKEMNTDVHFLYEVPATVNLYRQNVACLMATQISSQFTKILPRAVCLNYVSLNENKYQGTLGYQMKNVSANLSRNNLTLI